MTRGSTEIAMEIPVDIAWNALVAPGLRAWYHRLTPEGNFEEGHAIRWRDGRGEVVEESEIAELEPPRRMIAHTRFVFSPAYAQEPPHTMTWEITREGSGCRVRMSWDANDRVAHFLGSEGHYLLQSLRLEHDPVAQAEIARLPTIGELAIHDVTPDRLADYQTFFDHDAFRDFPTWQACYCMAPYRTGDEDPEPTAAENRREMSSKITRSTAVALLAYVDGKPSRVVQLRRDDVVRRPQEAVRPETGGGRRCGLDRMLRDRGTVSRPRCRNAFARRRDGPDA